MTRICLIPKYSGVGGPSSFQRKFASGLISLGIDVCYDLADYPYSAVLVIGGTRQLAALWQIRKKGIPIIQRLDGLNWTHRSRRTGWRHYFRSEKNNLLLRIIRRIIASKVIYQSQFVKDWWERDYGTVDIPSKVIYNGVNLNIYSPQGIAQPPTDHYRLMVAEGNYGHGFEPCLENAIRLAEMLKESYHRSINLVIAGGVPADVKAHWQSKAKVSVTWAGLVPPEKMPDYARSSHLFFSAEINAPSPNAVIEAMACGLPVVSFETGSLPELVRDGAGLLVPYDGNPWKFDPPDIKALARAADQILTDLPNYRSAARARAEAAFSLEAMVTHYLQVLTQ